MKKYLIIIDCGGVEGIDNIVVIYANSKKDVGEEFIKVKGYELDKICSVIVDMDEFKNGWSYF